MGAFLLRPPTNTKAPASTSAAGAEKEIWDVSSGEAMPASAALRAKTMGLIVTRAVVLIRLTRFRSNCLLRET
ncbi:hypothetical protein GCM10007235_14440 [Pseudoxanthomonas indica]|nr:hypothetical protein GCM10007235_14440 [Pseudoxanthomonas indica]